MADSRFIRRGDDPGTVLEGWEAGELEEGMSVPELGTLELWCVARDGTRRWKVEFNVRQPS